VVVRVGIAVAAAGLGWVGLGWVERICLSVRSGGSKLSSI